jgi:hypothetical protein
MAVGGLERSELHPPAWTTDPVTTRDGISIPVRATARRPRWEDLPAAVRAHIEAAAGSAVVVERVLAAHPLTRDVDARSIDALLANLWLYFTTRMEDPVPEFAPHLRDHQHWYAEVTEGWLHERLQAESSAEQGVSSL